MLWLLPALLVLSPDVAHSPQEIRGAALVRPDELWTWGKRLDRWRLPGLRRQTLGRFPTLPGGCVFDIDGDGQLDLIAPTPGGLAWFRAPHWQRNILDREAETSACLGTELLGRRGILTVHLGAQVRFYEWQSGAWPYREIYSFYTASYQAGLLLYDVDGDTRPDIFCGNYWIQSPAEFDLPWRLFAINTWSEQPRSAMAGLALLGGALVWTESAYAPGRVALFQRPADPKILWEPRRAAGPFAYPQAVAVHDGVAYVGENNGAASRLLSLDAAGQTQVVAHGPPIRQLLSSPHGLVAISPRRVALYRPPRK